MHGFNHIKHSCHTPAAVPIHPLLTKDGEEESLVGEMWVDKEHRVFLIVGKSRNKYMYSG